VEGCSGVPQLARVAGRILISGLEESAARAPSVVLTTQLVKGGSFAPDPNRNMVPTTMLYTDVINVRVRNA